MRIIIALALMVFLCGSVWAQPMPATPPSPESLGIQAPPPYSSIQAPPASESSQALAPTTQVSAMAAAPSTMTTSTTSAYMMVVPPETSTPNQFYIPYYPSTVASCYFDQWVPMWLDVKGYGSLYSYEWYPNGELVSQYLANVAYPSWQKMWFYGDATGWHILQYYCNGWSNYIYVYVSSEVPYAPPSVYPPMYPSEYPPMPPQGHLPMSPQGHPPMPPQEYPPMSPPHPAQLPAPSVGPSVTPY